MIRIVFGSTLAAAGIVLTGVLVGPGLLIGSRGEPILLVATDQPAFQPASFEGPECAAVLLLGERDGDEPSLVGGDDVFAAEIVPDDVLLTIRTIAGSVLLLMPDDRRTGSHGAGTPVADFVELPTEPCAADRAILGSI